MTAIPRRILIIDHDEQVRKLLCEQLTGLGFAVTEEDSALSGLSRMASQAANTPFHGLLVELQLPVLGGLAVLQEMSERFPTVPVIAMSDTAHVGKLRQAVKLGAREYLLKPFDTELLRRKCMSVFHDQDGAMTTYLKDHTV
ncbi:MAG: response regulator [Nitrospiraceae bacterium]|nr:response regulator [Nitrospiraceae bacterium]